MGHKFNNVKLVINFVGNKPVSWETALGHQLQIHPRQIYIFMSDSSQPQFKKTRHDHLIRKQQRKRFRYCCRKCKHTEKGKKSCVCVVPLSQRRANVTEVGCQACGCHGCSVEDYVSRGEDPEYRAKQRTIKVNHRNPCCKQCLGQGRNRPCVCQLPKSRRRGHIGGTGCKMCGCFGCNNQENSSNQSQSESESKSIQSSIVSRKYDDINYNLDNMDKSPLGRVIRVQYNLYPAMVGMGIPQRTPSYILGKPL